MGALLRRIRKGLEKMKVLLNNKLYVYVAGMALFFCAFRYYGYFEDAGRYLLQVIHFLYPERFVDDVPFMFGNQDEFTIFSPLMSVFLKLFGVNYGGMVAVFLMDFFWGLAALALFIKWLEQWNASIWSLPLFAICIISLTNKLYGSGAYFPIIDHIFVARFVSEIFILYGLAFFWAQNKFISLGLFLIASLFHPLMGGWGVPLWLFYHFPKTRYILSLLALLLPLTGFLHVGRFDFYTEGWLDGCIPYVPNVEDSVFFACLLLFWFAVKKISKKTYVRRFAASVFLLYLIGIYWQYAGTGLQHELLVQIQPYRVLWIGFVPMFPLSFLVFKDFVDRKNAIMKWFQKKQKLVKLLSAIASLLFVVLLMLENVAQLGLEHDLGNIWIALDLKSALVHFTWLRNVLLAVLGVICFFGKKEKLSIVFILSFFNEWMSIYPLLGIIFYWFPQKQNPLKAGLIAVAAACLVVEFFSSLQNSPLLGNALESSMFLVLIFVLFLIVLLIPNITCQKIIFCSLVVIFAIYGVRHWDARPENWVEDEMQMDQFFEETVFPQIKKRGRILIVESAEFPLQSRFKFLTGSYADETINIGGVFYKGQFDEAKHRKAALFEKDSVWREPLNYAETIRNVYTNLDTLLSRVEYLCNAGEITHFASDYLDVPLVKIDSVYLNVKKKRVFLYSCAKNATL